MQRVSVILSRLDLYSGSATDFYCEIMVCTVCKVKIVLVTQVYSTSKNANLSCYNSTWQCNHVELENLFESWCSGWTIHSRLLTVKYTISKIIQ